MTGIDHELGSKLATQGALKLQKVVIVRAVFCDLMNQSLHLSCCGTFFPPLQRGSPTSPLHFAPRIIPLLLSRSLFSILW